MWGRLSGEQAETELDLATDKCLGLPTRAGTDFTGWRA